MVQENHGASALIIPGTILQNANISDLDHVMQLDDTNGRASPSKRFLRYPLPNLHNLILISLLVFFLAKNVSSSPEGPVTMLPVLSSFLFDLQTTNRAFLPRKQHKFCHVATNARKKFLKKFCFSSYRIKRSDRGTYKHENFW